MFFLLALCFLKSENAYYLEFQFTVKVDDYNMIKGEVLITIGSTREPVELLMISANSLNVDDRFPTRRRLSNSSTHSDCSGLSHFTLPPSYSQLTSRAPSCETRKKKNSYDLCSKM